MSSGLEYTQVAVIREAECIGCMKCIKACPYDAIVGAAKLMHTVISDVCTGCELCVAPCPMDCIDMVAVNYSQETITQKVLISDWRKSRHDTRLARQQQAAASRHTELAAATAPINDRVQITAARKAFIHEALERVKMRKTPSKL